MFEWKNEYLMGVTAIDEQHKQLFRMGARFRDAIAAHKGKAMLEELLDSLARYMEGHFQVEERLMTSIDYPEREQHMAQHRDLHERLLNLQKRFDGGETITIQVLQFLSAWLNEHTATTDGRLGAYYRMKKEAGVTSA
jgi:hemerythrin-like metal-binding protein